MDRYTSGARAGIKAILPGLALGLGLVSCQGPANWVGKWDGKQQDLVNPNIHDPIAETLRNVHLELKADDSFVYTRAGIPVSGKAFYGAKEATLHPTHIFDQSIEKQGEAVVKANPDIKLTWMSDQEIKVTDPGSMGEQVIVLHRVPRG